jgi:hypothetical protein
MPANGASTIRARGQAAVAALNECPPS